MVLNLLIPYQKHYRRKKSIRSDKIKLQNKTSVNKGATICEYEQQKTVGNN
jgi:hypothetical protein